MSHLTDSSLVRQRLRRNRIDATDETISVSTICKRLEPLWPLCLLLAMTAACFLSGCNSEPSTAPEIKVTLELSPDPPETGQADVVVRLTDTANQPVGGAKLKLEGNMNHAGMKPSFSTLKEAEHGTYEGKLDFTMGGDWFVIVSAELPDGSKVDQKVDIPGVKAK
ncbi:MAG TPA: FixH family protein [Planctomycetaceae bacterium]|nr:FixH family protein [Planctomycetaceae bacterium]